MRRTSLNRRDAIAGMVGAVALGGALMEIRGAGGGEPGGGGLEIVVPAAVGGGFDTVARQSQHALTTNELTSTIEVLNLPCGGGTVGLNHVAQQPPRTDMLMVMGSSILGGVKITGSRATLDDITPLARLAEDYIVVVVRQDSPLDSLEDLVRAWAEQPRALAVAGGAVGTSDHLLAALMLERVGADPADLNYLVYSGDGEVLTALLSGTADVAVSSYNGMSAQIEAGEIRALGLSAAEPLPGTDVPTLRQAGLDMDLANWRGLAATGGLDQEQHEYLLGLVHELAQTQEWKDTVETFGWRDAYAAGADFSDFLEAESARLDDIIEGLGLS